MLIYQSLRNATQCRVPGMRVPLDAAADPTQAGFDFHYLYDQLDRRGKPIIDPRTGRPKPRNQHLPYHSR